MLSRGRVGELAVTGAGPSQPDWAEPSFLLSGARFATRARPPKNAGIAPALPVLAPAQGRGHGQPPLSPARLLLPEVGQEEVGMTNPHAADDKRVIQVLDRLGLGPLSVRKLHECAVDSGMSLREFVLYVLQDYEPAQEVGDVER